MTTRRYAPKYRRRMVELVRTGRTAGELSRSSSARRRRSVTGYGRRTLTRGVNGNRKLRTSGNRKLHTLDLPRRPRDRSENGRFGDRPTPPGARRPLLKRAGGALSTGLDSGNGIMR